jgi:4-hydroxybenzoate polyprenyltransferase
MKETSARALIGSYLRLARVSAWPAFSLTFTIPFGVGAHAGTAWGEALVGMAALFLVGAFSFALNFYADRDTDRHHDGVQKDFDIRRQPMLTGEISERQAQVFCTLTLSASIALGFVVGTTFGVMVLLASLVGGIMYSYPGIRLKARPFGDILCISALGMLVPSSGYLLATDNLPSILMMAFWFTVTGTGYVATVMSDYEFDVKAKLRTSAAFLGRNRALWVMVGFLVVSAVLGAFVYVRPYPSGTRYFALFAIAVLVLLTLSVWRSLRRDPDKVRVPLFAGSGGWIYVAPGIISLLFLAYAFVKILNPGFLPTDPFLVPGQPAYF